MHQIKLREKAQCVYSIKKETFNFTRANWIHLHEWTHFRVFCSYIHYCLLSRPSFLKLPVLHFSFILTCTSVWQRLAKERAALKMVVLCIVGSVVQYIVAEGGGGGCVSL